MTRKGGRAYLTVYIHDLRIKGLLDSGSAKTLVGKEGFKILEAAGLKLRSSWYQSVTTANKSQAKIKGEIAVPFSVCGKVRVVDVLFVPKLNQPLILGLDFWRRYNLRTDFVNDLCEVVDDDSPIVDLDEIEVEIVEKPPELEDVLSPDQRAQLQRLLEEFRPLLEPGRLGKIRGVEHHINTGEAQPLKTRYSNINPKMMKDVHQELDERLALGTVEPSESPWQSPLLILPKKDKGWRWVVDFRKLNSVVQAPNQYPLPRINPILSHMGKAAIITTIDIKDAYLQISLSEESKAKTAFYVPGRGLFQFTRLPAGLIDAANRWQRTIEMVLTDNFQSVDPHCIVYMDDLFLWSPAGDWEHHINLIRRVFQKLVGAGITINISKSKFARRIVKYLGHIIDSFGIRPDPAKTSAVINFPRPKSVKNIRQFLGLGQWMRKYVKNFSLLAKPLYERTKKGVSFVWGPEEEGAFLKLKEALCNDPVLHHPDFDRRFKIYTDGSSEGTGGILAQDFDDGEHVIAYTSRTLRGREKTYSATELECLGALHAIEAFRPYVEGYEFDLITDHVSLRWLHKLKNPAGRLARWAVHLQQYRFNIIHRKGSSMQAPDALSRNPEERSLEDERLEVAVLDFPETIQDSWYMSLMSKISENPEEYEKFCLKDNKIFKLITVHPTLPLKWVQLVPKDLRDAALKECHDEPSSGHGGWFRTFQRVRAKYYWPAMKQDIKDFVKKCQVCQSVKIERRRKPGLMGTGDVVTRPMELLSGDLIGPLPRSSGGFTFLSVFTDSFSKYVFIRPLRAATATAVLKHFKEDVVYKHGAPRLLLVDNGKQYRSEMFRKFCKDHSIKIRFNVAYNPRSNPTERMNQTLETVLCCYIKENQRQWCDHLPEIQAALNTSANATTGLSPHQILFGDNLILDGRERVFDGEAEEPQVLEDPVEDPAEVERREELFNDLKEKLKEAKAKYRNRYNLRRRPSEEFSPDSMVWRRNFAKSNKAKGFTKKLAPKWIGPYKVKDRVGRVSYMLTDLTGKMVEGPWHVDQLKRHHG